MIVKLTYIGGMQERNGKSFREIGAEGWTENKSAWKTAPDFDKYKVGDSVDVLVSENGKYINAVSAPGGRPTGGKAWSKSGSPAADPEKNVSVYTSYVLEYLIAPHQKTQLSIPDAVKLVFDIRDAVKAKFGVAATATASQPSTTSGEDAIKIDTAFALVEQIDSGADRKVWVPYVTATLKRKGGFDLLMKNLNACLTGEKLLDMTPDNIPVFVLVEPS
jgi:hypothetical protein